MKRFARLLGAALVVSSALAQNPPGNTVQPHKPLVLNTGSAPTPADIAQFIATAKAAFAMPLSAPMAGGPRPQATPTAQRPGVAPPMHYPGIAPPAQPSSPAPPAQPSGHVPSTQSISAGQPSTPNGFSMAAYNPSLWDPHIGRLDLEPTGSNQSMGIGSNPSTLAFDIQATPGNLYVLNIGFSSIVMCSTPTESFSIMQIQGNERKPPSGWPTEEVTLRWGAGTSGFAYAFDANASGNVEIQIMSNCPWTFVGAQLTTASK